MSTETIIPMNAQEHERAHEHLPRDPIPAIQLARIEKSINGVVKVFMGLAEQVRALDVIVQTLVTVTGAESKAIQAAVINRAQDFCAVSHVSYRIVGRKVRTAIWHDFLNEFSISNYHDLPRRRFQAAIEFIRDWRSYAMARKLGQLCKAGDGNG